jgi:hypothetical protein
MNILIEKSDDAKRSNPSRKSFSKKKMKRLSTKKLKKNPKSHRGYGDSLAVERFDILLNLR